MKTIYIFSFKYSKPMKMVKENIIPLSDGKGKLLTDDIQKAETFKPFSLPLSSHEKVVFDLITSIANTWAGGAERVTIKEGMN